MSLQFGGEIHALEREAAKLEPLARDGLRPLHPILASEAQVLVNEQFGLQESPLGVAWVARNPFFRGAGPSFVGSSYHASYQAQATADGFEVGSDHIGARVHTHGATIRPRRAKRLAIPAQGSPFGVVFARKAVIPARPAIPEGDPGPRWEDRLTAKIDDYMGRFFGE